ncbi:phosphonate C-P lyase system protein PhnG [Roseobacter sp. YSTF-M11]|uniref:Phosphonate C-P lyase system protein PhnG n=1 Tax=Roseobacter insulae TaxID=2859783 RepID=A0A9X1K1D1_9RHOB|nr:phosphonate C-P lyase system protein PhnG [Roseobacter insulae]MBW4707368.1 phosphonate C-P lyase system protein PhnG [Roseobacter insulae]
MMSTDPDAERKAWMSLLAKCRAPDLKRLWSAYGATPGHSILRAPEVGSVMVRGRSGAVGSAFNLGEMTITRCSVKLETGEDGHAYVQGRDPDKALHCALVDALMQSTASASVRAIILDPLQELAQARQQARASKAAATKVDFFTMVRGED